LRHQWLTVLQQQPNAGVSGIRKTQSALYSALYRLDYEWLMEHRPERRKSAGCPRCNWELRDAEASERLLDLLGEIESTALLPIRLTRTRLASAIGAKNWVQKHPERMPTLRSLLVNTTECSVRAACRRIRHVHAIFGKKRIRLSMLQLRRLSGIRKELEKKPEIVEALKTAYESLGKIALATVKSEAVFQEFRSDFDDLN
jgi:hypothetical protein